MRKIKSGDEVIVIAGKEKGKRGKIRSVIEKGARVIVEGLNMIKKHEKPNPQLGKAGGIIEREAPLQISNVAIFNPATSKADRVGFKALEDGKKVRIFRSNQELVDV